MVFTNPHRPYAFIDLFDGDHDKWKLSPLEAESMCKGCRVRYEHLVNHMQTLEASYHSEWRQYASDLEPVGARYRFAVAEKVRDGERRLREQREREIEEMEEARAERQRRREEAERIEREVEEDLARIRMEVKEEMDRAKERAPYVCRSDGGNHNWKTLSDGQLFCSKCAETRRV